MKHKKEANEDADTAPNHKRPHQGKRADPNEVESDGLHDSTSDSSRRTSFRRASLLAEDSGNAPSESKNTSYATCEDELADDLEDTESVAAAPTETPRKALKGINGNGPAETPLNGTPNKLLNGKHLFSTPVKVNGTSDVHKTLRLERNADRSARQKSTRTLIERNVLGDDSDNDEEEEDIAQHIYEEEEEDEGDQAGIDIPDAISQPETPSKRKQRNLKGPKNRKKSPTPPLEDLLPEEKYFFQNRPGKPKTSDNNLSKLVLLEHDEYFSLAENFKNPHQDDIESLHDLHAKSFMQWQFELSQSFNICVYGLGSKRKLLMRFADHIYKLQTNDKKYKIVVVNGYVKNLTIRDVLNTIAAAVSVPGQKMGSQPAEMLENLESLLEEDRSQDVTVIVHSIDQIPLRRPATQGILARLAAHRQVHFVASANHPSFPLLWDSSLRSTYNFLFHNCTTFQPHTAEYDAVDEVNELLGRSRRRVGGRAGATYVLKSLPGNAQGLFKLLVGEQLATMDDSYGNESGGVDEENNDNEQRLVKNIEPGIEYRVLYQKAVEEFICSNEINFRTLLKEFHDHQMIESRKDALGTEMLSVPFRKEELMTILEDIES